MFGCTYLGDGNDSTTGNVNYVAGQSGTIANGKTYNHLYQRGPDNYVDYIGANGGSIFFKSQDNLGRAVNYGGAANSYRAIHTTFVFGALRNGANTKSELMATYMQYLFFTGVEESATHPIFSSLSISPNPACRTSNVRFALPGDSRVKISVYNSAGQKVRTIVDANLKQGTHRFEWTGSDDSDRRVSSGSYILKIDINGQITNRAIVVAH